MGGGPHSGYIGPIYTTCQFRAKDFVHLRMRFYHSCGTSTSISSLLFIQLLLEGVCVALILVVGLRQMKVVFTLSLFVLLVVALVILGNSEVEDGGWRVETSGVSGSGARSSDESIIFDWVLLAELVLLGRGMASVVGLKE